MDEYRTPGRHLPGYRNRQGPCLFNALGRLAQARRTTLFIGEIEWRDVLGRFHSMGKFVGVLVALALHTFERRPYLPTLPFSNP